MLAKYWKAAIALVAIAGTAVGAVQADAAITQVTPSGWAYGISAVGSAIGTALVWMKRNEPTIEEAEQVLERARARGRHEA